MQSKYIFNKIVDRRQIQNAGTPYDSERRVLGKVCNHSQVGQIRDITKISERHVYQMHTQMVLLFRSTQTTCTII